MNIRKILAVLFLLCCTLVQIAGATALFYTHTPQPCAVAGGKTEAVNTTFGVFKNTPSTQDTFVLCVYEDKDQSDEEADIFFLPLIGKQGPVNAAKFISGGNCFTLIISRIGRYLLFCKLKFHC